MEEVWFFPNNIFQRIYVSPIWVVVFIDKFPHLDKFFKLMKEKNVVAN